MDDADALLELRNEPSTRRWSLDGARIPRAHHVAWLRGRLADPEDCRLWVAELDGEVMGQARVDRLGPGEGEISVGLAPAARGRGLGAWLIAAATARAAREMELRSVLAVIKPDNVASVRAFERAGYRPADTRERLGTPVVALRWEVAADG